MKLISLRGSHYDIGYEHGDATALEILKFCRLFHAKLAANNISRDTAVKIAGKFGKCTDKYAPWLLEEIRGIADGAGMKYETILSLNCMFEIPRIVGKKELHYCTVWGVTDGKQCIAVQNLDLAREYGELLTLMHIAPAGKRSVFLLVLPGMVGMMGMNQDGLSFSGTTVSSREARYGVPKPFLGRSIMHNCSNVHEAARALRDAPRTTGGNAMLADAHGGMQIIECSAVKCALIEPQNGYVASTNHYTDDDLYGLSPPDTTSSEARLARIRWLLEHAEKRDLETMFSIACDHEHEPDDLTICRHGSISTVSSLVFVPSEKCIWIAGGLPCSSSFKQYHVR